MILGLITVQLVRSTSGTRGTDGRFVISVPTTSYIKASIQPADGKTLQMLEEGQRQQDVKKMYTTTEVRTGDQHAGSKADKIVYSGVTYEVIKVSREYALIPHYKAILIRVKE
jgi:hypothetical protein